MRGWKYHRWTEEEDEFLRMEYKQTQRSAQLIGQKLNIPWGQVRGRVHTLGLGKISGRRNERYWTPEEDATLENLVGKYPVATISNKMKRGKNAIVNRIKRLKLSRRNRDGWYTKREVSEILGVDHHRVQTYIESGLLKATCHTGTRPGKGGQAMWHIDEKDLKKFIRTYPHEFQGRNVDLIQIVGILAGLETLPRSDS